MKHCDEVLLNNLIIVQQRRLTHAFNIKLCNIKFIPQTT